MRIPTAIAFASRRIAPVTTPRPVAFALAVAACLGAPGALAQEEPSWRANYGVSLIGLPIGTASVTAPSTAPATGSRCRRASPGSPAW